MPKLPAIVALLLISCAVLSAQEASPTFPSPSELYQEKKIIQHDFDERKWENLKEGIDYSARKKNEAPAPEKMSDELPTEGLGFGPVFKFLAILVAIGLAVLLMVKMAGGKNRFGPRNSALQPAVSVAEINRIEENLPDAELKDPLQRAIAKGDYSMAVRLYYLAVLQELALKKHIRWKRDKTNGAYLRELAGTPIFPMVQEVTVAFERVWYGDTALPRQDFDRLQRLFRDALSVLDS